MSKIDSLTGEANYQHWSFRVRQLLAKKLLSSHISDPPLDEGDGKYPEWLKLDQQAFAIVSETISDELLGLIMDLTSTKILWDTLAEKFNRKSTYSELSLRRKLYSQNLNTRPVTNYLSDITQIRNQLSTFPKNEEMETISIILNGLSQEYSNFCAIVDNLPERHLTVAEISSRLLNEESRLSNSLQTMEALASQKTSILKCSNCNSPNHSTIDCRRFCGKCQNKSHWTKHCRRRGANTAQSSGWILDSGATDHMCSDKGAFSNYSTCTNRITLGDNSSIECIGKGDVHVSSLNLTLRNVLHVPRIAKNLISVSALTSMGYQVFFEGRSCTISKDFSSTNLKSNNHLYEAHNASSDLDLIHLRLGHLATDGVREILSSDFYKDSFAKISSPDCTTCATTNSKRKPFGCRNYVQSKSVLETIHSDLWGPISTPSLSGSTYYVSFTDDHSRFSSVFFLSHKSQVSQAFLRFKNRCENLHGTKIKTLKCDNGGEFLSLSLKKICDEAGIRIDYSPPYTPQLNGVAESINRVLLTKTRALLGHANLDSKFWADAVNTANYLRNISPTRKLDKITPYERWYGSKPKVSHLRIWGCRAFVHNEGNHRKSKIQPRATPMIFVGYGDDHYGYRVFDPRSNKIFVRHHVSFDETVFPALEKKEIPSFFVEDDDLPIPLPQNDHLPPSDADAHTDIEELSSPRGIDPTEVELITEDVESEDEHSLEEVLVNDVREQGNDSETEEENRNFETGEVGQISEYQTFQQISTGSVPNKRTRKLPARFANIAKLDPPKSYNQAINSPEASLWKEAMEKEYSSLIENHTWDSVAYPKDRKPIHSMWVYSYKYDSSGQISNYKARLVAIGKVQQYGLDYQETFAPVVRWDTVRVILALSLQQSWKVNQLDVTTAFLYGEIDHEIFMMHPEGFKIPNEVCKLKKSIYGLKQSSRIWNAKLTDSIISQGLKQSQLDPCLFYSEEKNLFVLVYVDDILVTGDSIRCENMKNHLASIFKIKDLGEISNFLGVLVNKTRDGYSIDQSVYIEKTLAKFGMSECYTSKIPMQPNQTDTDRKPLDKSIPYREAIGNLNYLATISRPDIAFVVNFLSRQANSPTEFHWSIVIQLFRYLRGTLDKKLLVQKQSEHLITAYVDSDWAGDESRKSCSGFLMYFGSTLISWYSRLQPIVATCTMEAEYIALSLVMKDITWLRNLLQEINFPATSKATVFEDNQACIKYANDPGRFHQRSKHIDVRFHFVREKIQEGLVDLVYCPTSKMRADFLTKALPAPRFLELTGSI